MEKLKPFSFSVMLLMILMHLASANASVEVAKKPSAPSPVKLELYYESLCFGCQNFISGPLQDAWKSLQSTGIIDIHLYPFGNAKEIKNPDGTYTYKCQHGDEECVGNFQEACIIYKTRFNSTQYFPVIECMEASGDPVSFGRKCLKKFVPQIQWSSIQKCAKGPLGKKIMHQLAVKTGNLVPPHTYVPWITIDGNHTEKLEKEAWNDLVGLTCKLYHGPQKPKECLKYFHEEIEYVLFP